MGPMFRSWWVPFAVVVAGCAGEVTGAPDGGAGDAAVDATAPGTDGGPATDAGGTLDGGAAPDAGGATDGGGAADAGVPTGWLAGVNLAGAEFGEGSLPGTYGVEYTYPTDAEIDYFVASGMTVFRIPFRWERLQRSLMGDLDATELGRLDAVVAHATGAGAAVILDPHNYARYDGDVVGSSALSNDAFADFWARLAVVYADRPDVIFGLVNEPHTMPTEQWLAAANAAIAAIRDAGADNLILVPGNAWTGAHSWFDSWYGTPNADVMTGVVDPMDHFAYEVHQYLDDTSAGTDPACVSDTIGVERVSGFTDWLRTRGAHAMLGELGGGPNATCDAAVDGLLDHLEANDDVWLGWSWWAAGPWWGDYFLSIEPRSDGTDAPQMGVLSMHL